MTVLQPHDGPAYYEDCDCGRGRYNAAAYSSCYDCYQDRAASMASCIFCGRWHSPEFNTCYKCRTLHGRDEAGAGIRTYISWRDEHTCRNCGDNTVTQIDHIQPCRHGGKAALWNLQVLCSDCNRYKGDAWSPHSGWADIRRGLIAYYWTSGHRHWFDSYQHELARKEPDRHQPVKTLEVWEAWLNHDAGLINLDVWAEATNTGRVDWRSFTCPSCQQHTDTKYGIETPVCRPCWEQAQ